VTSAPRSRSCEREVGDKKATFEVVDDSSRRFLSEQTDPHVSELRQSWTHRYKGISVNLLTLFLTQDTLTLYLQSRTKAIENKPKGFPIIDLDFILANVSVLMPVLNTWKFHWDFPGSNIERHHCNPSPGKRGKRSDHIYLSPTASSVDTVIMANSTLKITSTVRLASGKRVPIS